MKIFQFMLLFPIVLVFLALPGIIFGFIVGYGIEFEQSTNFFVVRFKGGFLENSFHAWIILIVFFAQFIFLREYSYNLGKRLNMVQLHRVRFERAALLLGACCVAALTWLFTGYLKKEIVFRGHESIEIVNGFKAAHLNRKDIMYWCVQYFGTGKSRRLDAKIRFDPIATFKPVSRMLSESEVKSIGAIISPNLFESTRAAGEKAQTLLRLGFGTEVHEGCHSDPYGS